MQKQHKMRLRIYILSLYLLIMPIDATLGNLFGPISIINYLTILYVALRLITLLRERIKISSLVKCKMPFIYFIYFMVSISWSITKYLSSWYIFSLIGSFMMFLFSVIDTYSNDEYMFLKRSVVYSGVVVIIISFLNLDLNSRTRFVINIGRYMDPNYFSTGFILITAILVDNILKNRYKRASTTILILLIIIVLMTGSRGGLLANIAVIFTLIVFYRENNLKKVGKLLSGLIVFGTIFYFMQDLTPDWVLNRFAINNLLSGGGSGRFKIWSVNLSYYGNMSLLRLLFGNGFSTFSYISSKTLGIPKVAHSIYIQSLLEGGIVGLLITITLIIVAMRYSWKNNKYVFAALMGATIGGITLDIHISRFFWNILFFSTLPSYKTFK